MVRDTISRVRRSELIRNTTLYVARLVQALPGIDSGLYADPNGEPLTTEEANLAEKTCFAIADAIERRTERQRIAKQKNARVVG